MKPENQRIALTRRLLQEALLRLLEQKSVRQIAVSELCQEAGINRSTFYKHYGKPEDVLYEISENLVHELLADTLKGKPSYKSDIENLCLSIQKHVNVVSILLKNNISIDIKRFIELFIQDTGARYKKQAVLYDEEELRLLMTFLGYGSTYFIQEWIHSGMKKSPQELASLIYGVAAHGWLGLLEEGNSCD